MGFAPIKWTFTAFFRPRQLTDRAILASRQTQEKKGKGTAPGCAHLVGAQRYQADSHRWKAEETIAWLRKHGLHSVPNSIKADIGDLVYNGPKKTALDETSNFAPPPGRFVYFTGSRASNDPPPGL